MKKIAITLFFLSLFLPLFGENDYEDCVTPLYQACIDNNRIKIDLLLNKGVDINQKNPSCDERWDFSGETPLYAAIDQNNTDLVKYLIKRGARLDISTVNSGTPLHKAARSGNKELIQLLLDQGVDVNANLHDNDERPGYGGTGLALHMATDQDLFPQ